MDRYVKSEPTPEAFAGLLKIPADEPVTTVSLVRMRRDRAPEAINESLSTWRRMTRQLRAEYRCLEDVVARVRFSIAGPADHWDYLIVTRYESRRSLMRYVMDERILDSIYIRRQFIEENLALVLAGNNKPDPARPPLSIVPKQADVDAEVFIPVQQAIANARTLMGSNPLYVIALSRLRTDVPHAQALAAYLHWRRVLEEVAGPLGVTFPATANIAQIYIGEPGAWDMVNIVRYPNPDAYRTLLNDPRQQAAVPMRNLALESNLIMVAEELPADNPLD